MTGFITVTYQVRIIEKPEGEISFCEEQPKTSIIRQKAVIRKDTITRILETAQGSIIFMDDGASLAVEENVEVLQDKISGEK